MLTVYPGATSTPMASSKAGAAEGIEYQPPSRWPAPPSKPSWTAAVVRGGQQRRDLNATNRQDPSTVDRMLAERKPLLENVVAAQISI